MNPSVNPMSFFPAFCGEPCGSRSVQAEQTRVGSVSQQQSTELTITTDEGDTVTLNLASAMETNAGIYRSGSYEDGRAAYSQTAFFESSSSQSMAIEINGDLSEEELEDIREAVKTIGGMIDDFLSGDLQEMAKDGQLLKELDTISSLDAAFSYERQALYAEQDKVEISDVAPERNRRAHHHRRGRGRLQGLMNRIDRLTDNMAEQVKGFRGRRHHLAKSVRDLFGSYRRGEMAHAPKDQLGQGVIQTMQSSFVQKIQTLTESSNFNLAYTA